MAIGFVEMQGQITRAHDYTTIKHNDDTKGMVEQAHFGQQLTKQVDTSPSSFPIFSRHYLVQTKSAIFLPKRKLHFVQALQHQILLYLSLLLST